MTKLKRRPKKALVYLLFVAGIINLVVQASRQNIDLVTENYYAEEIQYQQRIDEKNNTQSLSAQLEINVHQGVLTVSFPEEFSQKELKGEVQLYCPSDAKKDLSRNLQMESNKMMISLPEQNQGFHQLKVKWEAEGVKYYFEKNLMLN
jgi:nitrogen fixation protein FixH